MGTRYGYFVNRTAHLAIAMGRRPIQWNEVFINFGNKLPKEAIVHAWNCRQCVKGAVAEGYNVINSQGWYLDHLSTSWESMYTNDPVEGVDNVTQEALVLGGQGEMVRIPTPTLPAWSARPACLGPMSAALCVRRAQSPARASI